MFDEMWQEIADAPGEIFDIPEMREFAEEIDPEDVVGYDDLSETLSIDPNYDFWIMNPDTYTFTGDAVTFLGLVGVISAGIIIVTSFRRFFNSPYNVRYVKPDTQEEQVTEN